MNRQRANLMSQVTFRCKASEVRVENGEGSVFLSATLTLNEFGECRLLVQKGSSGSKRFKAFSSGSTLKAS